MKVVLVAVHTGRTPQAVPLANAFLQAYLTTQPDLATGTTRADFYLGDAPKLCAAAILKERPDAVAFSLYLWNRELCRNIVTELRRCAPDIRLFAGGPEATAAPEAVLSDGYDFLICGEGETPFAEVCRRLAAGTDIADIPGIATRSAGGFRLTPGAPLKELDCIPSPWLSGTLKAKEFPGILWQLSRGCGFSCDFCFDSRDRHGVRRFSLERIEAELRHFAGNGVGQVFVLDSTFNQDKARAKSILRLIKKIAPRVHFHFEVRSEFIDREMAELFAAITCSLQIGLQSADPAVLKEVGRAFRPDEFSSRTMLLNDTGAVFGFDLIYGLPVDTLAGFRTSIDFALSLYPNHLDIFPLAILPGTALAARSAAIGLEYLPEPPYTLLATPTFHMPDMEIARRLAAACDIFYTRGRAVAWFNGMLHALGDLRPSTFLEEFGIWLETEAGGMGDEKDWTDTQIWELQRQFLKGRFSTKRLQRILPALLDLVDYHYHYAAALMTPPTTPVRKIAPNSLLLQRLRRTAATRLAPLQYEILEILDTGAADPLAIAQGLRPCGSWAIIYPTQDGVCTESVDELYFRLLEELDGSQIAGDVAERLIIPPDEAQDFLKFALNEGMVEPC